MPPIPWTVKVTQHPGSSLDDIWNEPSWEAHQHRIGMWNNQDRRPGLTHDGDEYLEEEEEEEEFKEEAIHDYRELKGRADKGELVNFRDIMLGEKDFHLREPANRSLGWRYVLHTTEDWVKNSEEWPANIQKRKKEEEAKKKEEDEQKKQNPRHDEQKNNSQADVDRKRPDSKNDDKNGDDQKKDRDQEETKEEDDDKGDAKKKGDHEIGSEEHDWKRSQGDGNKHHDAYAGSAANDDPQKAEQKKDDDSSDKKDENKTEYEKLREKYSPQEIALLQSLQHEKDYVSKMKQNSGKLVSPVRDHNRSTITIDEADQMSPDNWIPRSSDLIRLTGKHPLNAEAHLSHLFDAGMITPNELHYVRNHGAPPKLLWEFHKLDVEDGKLVLSMDDIKNNFDTINIPVALACDGNRRKELNMIKKSKGFSWGSGAVSCAYWKGPLLRDVLIAAGIPEQTYNAKDEETNSTRRWVNFEGADDPSEGKYATCIPLEYAMDPTNDVILAYEMNDVNLPPDHGYPIRLMIPGWVGGRCVKWLARIWVSDKENDSHYHIWDNRVCPSFLTEKDGPFAEALFKHPDTACNEQNLNSVIVKPTQGERIPLSEAKAGKTYRIEGYAYDGGGHEVQRVEVSLDGGETWLYCIRKFPDAPIRHGNKFWTWLHWHVDVDIVHLLSQKNITVRCFNVFKNTQPKEASWNVMGMMNNCWYQVKGEIDIDEESGEPGIFFRHPCEPGTGDGGWMKDSVENRIAQVKQEAGTPQKQFTRQEIEKHCTEKDCWLVVNGKVYDATSVLAWHPGGKAAIVGHAGKVHQETSEEFASIHDGYAYQKLKECSLGVVSEKAAEYIKKAAEAAAKDKAKSTSSKSKDIVLQKHRWTPVKLTGRKDISKDTRTYTFALPEGQPMLGLGTCQHVQIGFHLQDKMLIRSYTPTRPLLPPQDGDAQQQESGGDGHEVKQPDAKKHDSDKASDSGYDSDDLSPEAQRDGRGTFDLTVKTYFPTDSQPGGALSNILDCMPIGEEVEIRGPTGDIVYHGKGQFTIEGEKRTFKRVNLVLGGSGVTPGYALIVRILLGEDDDTQVRVVDANKSEADILLKESLDELEKRGSQQLKCTHVLSHPSDDWKGKKGHVNAEIIKEALFEPAEDTACFLCGPPAMIQKAALPALKDWGYEEEKNCFGF